MIRHIPMQKRIVLFLLACSLLIAVTACHSIVPAMPEMLNVYATTWPIYAMTSRLLEGVPDVSLHLLIQPQDECIRSYALSRWDQELLADADAVVCGEYGLEGFSLDDLSQDRFALIEALPEDALIHMNDDVSDEATHFDGVNPHAYMSFECADLMLERIAYSFTVLDPRYADQYEENLVDARQELHDIIPEYSENDIIGIIAAVATETAYYPLNELGIETIPLEREPGEDLSETQLTKILPSIAEADMMLIESQAPKHLKDMLMDSGVHLVEIDVMSAHDETEEWETYCNCMKQNYDAILTASSGSSKQ